MASTAVVGAADTGVTDATAADASATGLLGATSTTAAALDAVPLSAPCAFAAAAVAVFSAAFVAELAARDAGSLPPVCTALLLLQPPCNSARKHSQCNSVARAGPRTHSANGSGSKTPAQGAPSPLKRISTIVTVVFVSSGCRFPLADGVRVHERRCRALRSTSTTGGMHAAVERTAGRRQRLRAADGRRLLGPPHLRCCR